MVAAIRNNVSVKQILHQILNFIRFEVLEMLKTTLLQWRLCPTNILMPTTVESQRVTMDRSP